MKLVLLALFVAVASAKLHWKNTGKWQTIALAADNKEKVEENGPLRGFLRDIECKNRHCNSVNLTFWVKNNGVCEKFTVVGDRAPGSEGYTAAFSGQNRFNFCYQSENVLMMCIRNTDENGTVTHMVVAAIRPGYDHTNAHEAHEMYAKLVKENGIPAENVMLVEFKDPCPQ
ncbi:lipocalin Cav p 2.0101-like [Sorex araneus]|uniref:lipocalin Cav p 2.0101-like n=1 Tax=Sorex araneus TaxID=42254 RepID=UPI002433467B|nr:lipocalin Cav p 2.0101-like [Sorex araneus]